jgi:peptidoglycan/LPS O-acetylase OafA/YrhL
MKYRSDIDGLRALAVVPVVLFHAGFTTFSGGFVGVDVFFVISGYLITKILLDEIQQGSFSIINFYERRARRILPALVTVLAFTSIGTYLLYFPADFVSYCKSVLSTLGFGSNILFWLESGNYFEASEGSKPLLHTWSLSVEYVAQSLKILLWLAFFGSLAISIYGVFNHPKATFYLLPTRAWELLLGSLAAASFITLPKKQYFRETASFLGCALIIGSIFLLSEDNLFPGYNALYPCVGALLIIIAGKDGFTSVSGRVLSFKPIVFIGLISYSLYLWHWPIIVLFKTYNIDGLGTDQQAITVFISVILAALTWRYVERPFRGKSSVFSRKQIFTYSAYASTAFVIFSFIALKTNGLPNRFDGEVWRLMNFENSKDITQEKCIGFGHERITCAYGNKNEVPTIALWGDSHSFALLTMLDKLAFEKNSSFLHYGNHGCPPLYGLRSSLDRAKECTDSIAPLYKKLMSQKSIETVILVGRWAASVKGSARSIIPSSGEDAPLSQSKKDRQLSSLMFSIKRLTAFLKTVKKLY